MKQISWDIHLSVLSATGELDEDIIPLYGSSEEEDEERVFRLTDAIALQNIAQGQQGKV